MRLTTIILLIAIVQVSAVTYAQKITLSERNVPLASLLKQIRVQSGYDFFYKTEILKNAKPVSISVKNADLKDVLDRIFDNQPLQYEVKGETVTVSKKETSLLDKVRSVIVNSPVILNLFQDLRGRVLDENGKPLPNASIRVKGKNAVANTNQNGEFELNGVDEDVVLLVSYVGYQQLEIAVKGAVMPLEIRLNVATGELEEVNVVSTGYQNLPKERATGSFTVIDNKTLNQQVGTNILKRLEGVTNGLQFLNKQDRNRKLGIAIRGFSTINGPLDPLVVLDGFIYEGNIENINPNDLWGQMYWIEF